MKNIVLPTLLAVMLAPASAIAAHQANGIKIGEVTAHNAIVWTRLTKAAERNTDGKPFPKNSDKKRRSLPYDDLDVMEGAVPGTTGSVRLRYWPQTRRAAATTTDWQAAPVRTLRSDFRNQIHRHCRGTPGGHRRDQFDGAGILCDRSD